MELLIKSQDKQKAKKYFSKFQSILMQVAKTKIISKKNLRENFKSFKKNFVTSIISSKLIFFIYIFDLKLKQNIVSYPSCKLFKFFLSLR